MGDLATKREREKQVVSQMIALYCRKKHGARNSFARHALRWTGMPVSAATAAPLWRRKPFAPTAGCIVTGQICGSRFAR